MQSPAYSQNGQQPMMQQPSQGFSLVRYPLSACWTKLYGVYSQIMALARVVYHEQFEAYNFLPTDAPICSRCHRLWNANAPGSYGYATYAKWSFAYLPTGSLWVNLFFGISWNSVLWVSFPLLDFSFFFASAALSTRNGLWAADTSVDKFFLCQHACWQHRKDFRQFRRHVYGQRIWQFTGWTKHLPPALARRKFHNLGLFNPGNNMFGKESNHI